MSRKHIIEASLTCQKLCDSISRTEMIGKEHSTIILCSRKYVNQWKFLRKIRRNILLYYINSLLLKCISSIYIYVYCMKFKILSITLFLISTFMCDKIFSIQCKIYQFSYVNFQLCYDYFTKIFCYKNLKSRNFYAYCFLGSRQ